MVKPITRTYREHVCQVCEPGDRREVLVEVPEQECNWEDQEPICEAKYEEDCKEVPEEKCVTRQNEKCMDMPQEECKPVTRKRCHQKPMQVLVSTFKEAIFDFT